jgi:clathrin heavy chain
LAESLLAFFIEAKDKECFTAMLFTCYDLLKPDVVLELAWRNDMMDAAMPYVIQSVKQYTGKIDTIDIKEQKKEKEEEKSKSAVNDFVPDMPMGGGVPGFGNLAIGYTPGAGVAPGMAAMGMGGGMPGMNPMGGMGGF